MRIAICDDEQEELRNLQDLVIKYDSCAEVTLFSASKDLLDAAQNQDFDIALLDIEMGGMNGYTAAKHLVRMKNPPLIVFVTNSGEYTVRGYEVAFRYLQKPVSYEMLSRVLTAAMERIKPQQITITEDGGTYILPINDIAYFEAFGHRLVTHTTGRDYDSRMKMCDIEASLSGNAFASPHKGYLVNLGFVDSVREHEIYLTSGGKVPLSRRRKQDFEQALFHYVRRQ